MAMDHKTLVETARREIEELTPQDAMTRLGRDDTVFVDLRDWLEIERDGAVPGAFHMPRGNLEFWIDPTSPYHKPIFASGKRFSSIARPVYARRWPRRSRSVWD